MLGTNDPAPNFSGNDVLTGNPFELIDHNTKVVCLGIVTYWNTNVDLVKAMQKLWNYYQNQGEPVQMVAVTVDSWPQGWVNRLNDLAAEGTPITYPTIQSAYNDPDPNRPFNTYQCGNLTDLPQYFIIRCAPVGQPQIIYYSKPGFVGDETGADYSLLQNKIEDALDLCPFKRDPVAIEMIMDVSGSMLSYAPSTNDTKLSIMKTAAHEIVEFLGENALPDDTMGLIWFTDDVDEFSIAGNYFFNLATNYASLATQVLIHGTGNCTAMGAGLQRAFQRLSAPNQTLKRFAILLTDGMQNIYPMVNQVGSHLEIINVGNDYCGPPSSVAPAPGVNITLYDTTVHTLGVGITTDYIPLLQNIANDTHGFYKTTYDPATDLDLMYFDNLLACIKDSSPTIVHHSTGDFYPQECQTIETFLINKSIRKFTAFLSWRESMKGSLTFWLHAPDGSLINLHNNMKFFDTFVMATVYLPQDKSGSLSQYVGTWKMTIRGETDETVVPYHTLIIGEDGGVHFTFSCPKKVYEVGDIVPLTVKLEELGKPVLNPNDLVLEISKLATPLTELLAEYRLYEYPFREKMTLTGEKKTPNMLELKLEAMSNDPSMQQKILPIRNKCSLKQGTLSINVTQKEIVLPILLKDPGVHTFRLTAYFNTKRSGPIQREGILSINVKPGKSDPKLSLVNIIPILKKKVKSAMLNVTPRNASGQLLGAGLGTQFRIYLADKEIESNVIDYLNGTYQFELLPKKISVTGKKITIKFQDKQIWTGTIK